MQWLQWRSDAGCGAAPLESEACPPSLLAVATEEGAALAATEEGAPRRAPAELVESEPWQWHELVHLALPSEPAELHPASAAIATRARKHRGILFIDQD